jgi:hypothetical protein
MNFYSDEPWGTEAGRVYEGEGGLSYETKTSMDGKSHETVCLQWTFTQMSPGGREYEGEGGLSYETITSMDEEKNLMKLSV